MADILAQIRPNQTQQLIQFPEGWGQGRALFGGLTAAAIARFIQQQGLADVPMRSITVSFVAPVAAGEAELGFRLLRQGKAVTQVAAEISQQGQVVLSALASLGAGRPSSIAVEQEPCAELGDKAQGMALPEMDVVPEFAKHFDYRITRGGIPYTGQNERDFGGWIRLKDADKPVTVPTILALVDAWPPALLPHLKQPAPASSLTWTIEFLDRDLSHFSGADWWQYQAIIEHAENGYGHCRATLWDAQGQLVALSRQTVTVFG
ncbi:thioesterase family protein [Idiomarina tyrosinivorans]|uniref:Thioesterase family protein n=1 Tax=Idiomarina tyrosinivorans TaxID=1445662 RepID=A0A432ZUD2_9GAMM|nr:thioesterase family protein [Idiomarina tyrosinivorans]